MDSDSRLGADMRKRLEQIRLADVVIGIPSHRNGRDIGAVIDALVRGVSTYLGDRRIVLINVDGGSSDDTIQQVLDAPFPSNVAKVAGLYEGTIGKGAAIRAIFEASTILHARACLVVEARVPGIRSDWVPALVDPVLRGADYALGCYRKSGYGAALTDNLAYPFFRMFLNADLREPMVSEFCVSGEVATELADLDVWETAVARYGINVWVAIQAIVGPRPACQVQLGGRGDPSGDPGAPIDLRFAHSVGTMFRLLTVHRKRWQNDAPQRRIPFEGERHLGHPSPASDHEDVLVRSLYESRSQCSARWQRIMSPNTFRDVVGLFGQPIDTFSFPVGLWGRVALEFAANFNQGDGDPDKVVAALLPLFYGRAAAYIRQTATLSVEAREAIVSQMCDAFVALRPLFDQHWQSYDSWFDRGGAYWLT